MKPHLCHVLPAFGTGGPEVRTALVIDASADAFRHTVVSLSGDLGGRTRIRSAVEFLAAARPGGRVGAVRSLAGLLRGLRPDLLLTYGWGGTDGLLAARLCGIRRVVHAEDGFLPDEAARQRPHRLLARRALLRLPARVICPSQTLVRIATRQWWLPPRRIRYIPNGVDAAHFAPGPPGAAEAARRRLGCSAEEVVVGTVGRLGAEKNQGRLLRAFAALAARRPAKLLIVGDGPLRGELEGLARRLGLEGRVLFAGQADDPVDFYRAMDIFALSSDTEQMPIVVLEAMGIGLPVIGTDVGDVRGMVAPENRRLVVPPSREEDFAAALIELADDAGARARLGGGNREECVRRYGLEAMIQEYLGLYREALEPAR